MKKMGLGSFYVCCHAVFFSWNARSWCAHESPKDVKRAREIFLCACCTVVDFVIMIHFSNSYIPWFFSLKMQKIMTLPFIISRTRHKSDYTVQMKRRPRKSMVAKMAFERAMVESRAAAFTVVRYESCDYQNGWKMPQLCLGPVGVDGGGSLNGWKQLFQQQSAASKSANEAQTPSQPCGICGWA